jgi:hypothetical protein
MFVRIYKGLFLVGMLAVQGCVNLHPAVRPMPFPDAQQSQEIRQKTYDEYAVFRIDFEHERAYDDLTRWTTDNFIPAYRSKNPDLMNLKKWQMDDYYRQAGAADAVSLAEKGNRRFWAAEGSMISGCAVMVAFPVVVLSGGDVKDSAHSLAYLEPLGIGLAALGFWLLHDATVNYYYPGVDAFDKYLRERLNLSLVPQNSGAAVQTSF